MANPNPPIDYIIRGKIINNLKQPISGAKIISTIGDNTTTESTGDFFLEGKYIPGNIFSISIIAKKYSEKTQIPFTLNKEIVNNLPPIELLPTNIDLTDEINKELPLTFPQIKTFQLSKTNFEMAQQQAINKIISQVKTVLLPQVLTLIAQFGISQASKAIGKKFGNMNATCPPNLDELNSLIEKKNKLTKALNNIYNFLNTVRVGVQIVDTVLTVAQIVVIALKAAATLPPVPVEPTSSLIQKIENELKKYKLISSSTLLLLVILTEILLRIIELLKSLDILIGGCSLEGALPQEQLNEDLLKATQEQSQQLSPVVTNVNGFKMDVITVDGNTNFELKRRRAVARNRAGVIMLQGEPSFSSNDQILIDELIFYIQQNDLKAD
jgi:hypothetical protein